jgi:hypothetical protein
MSGCRRHASAWSNRNRPLRSRDGADDPAIHHGDRASTFIAAASARQRIGVSVTQPPESPHGDLMKCRRSSSISGGAQFSIMFRATASATLMPSTAAERMPPA